MNQSTLATKLLTLFASGGTFERAVADLPMFNAQIEAAVDSMKTAGRCSSLELGERAAQLRDIVRLKDTAIRNHDFYLAAKLRDDECAIFEALGLGAAPGDTWHAVLCVGVDEQLRRISEFLYDSNVA